MRKSGSREIPPPLELHCLRMLWVLGEANVSQIRTSLAPDRNLAYTTVMTLMDRLAKKGAVERRKQGRSFVYAPVLSRETLRRAAVKELVDSFFGGSEEELIAYLVSPQEPEEAPRANAAAAGADGSGAANATPESDLDTALL